MHWEVIDTGIATADQNMEFDRKLLSQLSTIEHGIVHFYEWSEDSATYGYFIDPYTVLDAHAVQRCGLQLAKRPTGGGIIFHLWDVAFSILVPAAHPNFSLNTLDNYAFINNIVAEAIKKLLDNKIPSYLLCQEPHVNEQQSSSFCMAKPTINDVMIESGKIAGGAQRRTKHGYLHQGTVALVAPSEEYLKNIMLCPKVVEDMRHNSSALIHTSQSKQQLKAIRQEFKHNLVEAVKRSL